MLKVRRARADEFDQVLDFYTNMIDGDARYGIRRVLGARRAPVVGVFARIGGCGRGVRGAG